ncbi:MFS transporter [Symbioplanes lichenis]|uniref:MFS transporter n=1 Tax=Symbioplanes lichenis TaxID=1629072 RepID=UPI002738BF7A|nr:MFS transporter [Actinoplanes lichenis]
MSVFWRWWTAGTVSSLGTAIGGVALPLTALAVLDASPFQMGLIVAARYAAWIVIGLPSGVIVQRLPLRGTQVGADLARALAVGSVPVAWWLGTLSVTHLVVTALVISFANVLFDVANSTFLPEIVGRDQLQSRNSLTSGTHASTELGGPSLGGLIVQVAGAVPTLLFDAVSYLFSAAMLRGLPARRAARRDTWPPMAEMIREGFSYVVRHPVMGPGMWAATAVNFVCGVHHALFPLYLVRDLHASPGVVGLMLATDGVGTLVGAALTTRLTDAVGTARALLITGGTAAVGALLIAAGDGGAAYVTFAAGNLVFAGSVVVLSVTTRTYRQTESPPELLSRVMATVRFVSWGAIPIGGLLAGAAAGLVGARVTLIAAGVVAVCAPVAWLLSPARGKRDLAEVQL